MNADRFSPDIVDFVRTLENHAVRYLLIGGHAVFYHGYARLTADVDFAYDPAPDNAERLFRALAEFWNGWVPNVESAADLEQPGIIVQFGRAPNRIDLLSRVKGIDFTTAWEHRIDETLDGNGASTPIRIVALSDLRKAKRAAGRAKDIDDLENLPAR